MVLENIPVHSSNISCIATEWKRLISHLLFVSVLWRKRIYGMNIYVNGTYKNGLQAVVKLVQQ